MRQGRRSLKLMWFRGMKELCSILSYLDLIRSVITSVRLGSVFRRSCNTKNVAVTVSISISVIWMLHRSKGRPYFIYFGI